MTLKNGQKVQRIIEKTKFSKTGQVMSHSMERVQNPQEKINLKQSLDDLLVHDLHHKPEKDGHLVVQPRKKRKGRKKGSQNGIPFPDDFEHLSTKKIREGIKEGIEDFEKIASGVKKVLGSIFDPNSVPKVDVEPEELPEPKRRKKRGRGGNRRKRTSFGRLRESRSVENNEETLEDAKPEKMKKRGFRYASHSKHSKSKSNEGKEKK